MKNKRVTASLCAGLLLVAAVGCGKSDEYFELPKVEVIEVDNVTDTSAEENSNYQNSDEERNSQSSSEENTNNAQLPSDFELDGDIESIGDNSVVINEVFHLSDNVSVAYENVEEKVLITVYFSEETKFEVWTIKNGGMNGDADTEKRQGTFSDLKHDTYISMTGSYSGNDFYAKQVVIHYYI